MSDLMRRAHARVHCDLPVRVLAGTHSAFVVGDGRLLDVSFSGARLAVAGELQRSKPYRLELEQFAERIVLSFRVVRESARESRHPEMTCYGVHFNLTADQEADWRRILQRFQRHPTDSRTRLERTLRGYWDA